MGKPRIERTVPESADSAIWMGCDPPRYEGDAVWTINGRHHDMNRLPRIDEPPASGETQAVPDMKGPRRGR